MYQVSVAEGDEVKAGDVLVELQAPELEAQFVRRRPSATGEADWSG